MGYLQRKEVKVTRLTCSHPKVLRIWEYGSLSAYPINSEMNRTICVLLEGNVSAIEFKDKADGSAEIELEKYLENLK